jgi:hypothetical protein
VLTSVAPAAIIHYEPEQATCAKITRDEVRGGLARCRGVVRG